MSYIRWDGESRLRVVVSLVLLAISAYVFATTASTYYLHFPAVAGLVVAIYGLLLAVVPALRAKSGTPHRALIVTASWAVVLLVIVVVGRLAYST